MPNKVVVFGGCGFIGSYVVEELINNNFEVISADLNPSKYINQKNFILPDNILYQKNITEKECDNSVQF